MDVKSCEILISGTLSSTVDLEDCEILGLILPALDNTDLTFKACSTDSVADGDFVTVKAKDATTLTITATTGDFAVTSDDLVGLKGYRFVKIVASAGQDSAAVTFTWLLKKNWKR